MGAFKEPHGGELKDLYLDAEAAEQEKARAKDLASWDLTPRQLCDIDLLLNGAFSPLEGFLNRADYDSVCDNMRLENGVLWPMPITLDVDDGADATVNASWLNGGFESDLPFTLDGRIGKRSARGVLGDGGPELELQTVNGSIRIR